MTAMDSVQRVIKYSNLDYFKVLQLPVDTFKLMIRQSVIEDLLKTEEGKETLKNYLNYKKTELNDNDIEKLKRFGGG